MERVAPAETIIRAGVKKRNIVYLAGTGRAKPQEVKIGWKDNQWVEIVSGLEEGQTVMLNAPAPGKEKEGNK